VRKLGVQAWCLFNYNLQVACENAAAAPPAAAAAVSSDGAPVLTATEPPRQNGINTTRSRIQT